MKNYLKISKGIDQLKPMGKCYLLGFMLLFSSAGCNAKDSFEDVEKPQINPPAVSEEKFSIGIYVAPPKEYTLDSHYKIIKDAHINLIQDISGHYSVAEKKAMLVMAAKYGINLFVADNRMNGNNSDIKNLINDYSSFEASVGYTIKDEPTVAELNDAASRYKRVLSEDPSSIPHVNLFPSYATGALGPINYEKDYVEKWIQLVGAENLKYLSFDNYPFMKDGSLREDAYFHDLDVIRRMGLKYNIKTSAYLQSIGSSIGLKRPNTDELRYSAYSNLAYGIKLPVWFTYWTPIGGEEKFTNAIVDDKGNKTDLYPEFSKINKEMMVIGATLLKLEAINVYHTGASQPANTINLPDDFHITIKETEKPFIITDFYDLKSNKRYVMLVNKSLNKSENISIKMKNGKSLSEISKIDGTLTKKEMVASEFKDIFVPGEGKLYAIN